MAVGIAILGSTGSIGRQALEVVRCFPDDFRVVGLAGGRNLNLLAEQVREWQPDYVAAPGLGGARTWNGARLATLSELSELPGAERVLISTVGATGLLPTIAAVRAGKTVLLANKEVLVMAGAQVMAEARAHGATILPVDSEHSAIWQCLVGDCAVGTGSTDGPIQRIVLTASGGAFRDFAPDQLRSVTPDQALAHPTWVMGPKVTIDSATLMNKGFEVIEAHWLFGLPYRQIDVVLHRESIVHALVEFVDGAIKAELGPADMRLPIQHALTYPARRSGAWPRLRLEDLGRLTFAPLDRTRYPCFGLALAAAEAAGTAPVVLNAADDVAVESFLAGGLPFTGIAETVDRALQRHAVSAAPALDEILQLDAETRRAVRAELARQRKTS